MRTDSFRSIIVGLMLAFLVSPALAEEADDWLPGELSGNVAVYSDYSFRGVSQTSRDTALQGGMDWSHDTGIYAGLWGSTVGFLGGSGIQADLELDFYAGYAGEIDNFSYDIGAIFFYYPPEESLNYWEFALGLGYDFDVVSISAGLIGSPDLYKLGSAGLYIPAGIAIPIPADLPVGLTVDANVGYTTLVVDEDKADIISNNDYTDWNVGVVVDLPKNLGLDLRYVGTSEADELHDAGHRFIIGATYSF